MPEAEEFPAHLHLADKLIERASKEEQADVARLLALNIGWYRQRYGDVPQEELLRMVKAETLNDDAKRLVLHGMENLISALGEVMGPLEGLLDELRH